MSDHASADAPAVVVDHVSKRYARRSLLSLRRGADVREGTQALSEVSFAVRPGETIGLLGPNGAGKTTLLKIIATLLHPSGGRVLVDGRDIHAHSARARGMMGLVTCDERSFYWRLTGRHNLMFFAALYGLPKARARRSIDELLDALNLTEAADRPYYGYSSGMKQKLAIARGLLNEPRIVLYDEPTRSLDPLSAEAIRGWIVDKRRRSPDQTHVIATNSLREAEQLCDRVLIISRGRLIAEGTIQDIRERWHQSDQDVHRVTYEGPDINGSILAADAGLLELQRDATDDGRVTLTLRAAKDGPALSQLLAAILGAGGRVVRCETEQLPFDEVFCTLVQRDRVGGATVAAVAAEGR